MNIAREKQPGMHKHVKQGDYPFSQNDMSKQHISRKGN